MLLCHVLVYAVTADCACLHFLVLALPQATPRFYLAAVEKNQENSWDHLGHRPETLMAAR